MYTLNLERSAVQILENLGIINKAKVNITFIVCGSAELCVYFNRVALLQDVAGESVVFLAGLQSTQNL